VKTREERLAYQKAWKLANPDKVREYTRRSRDKNRDRARERQYEWRRKNRAKYLEQHAAQGRASRARNPLNHVDQGLRKLYGITLDAYNEMLGAQGGVCAICGQPETRTFRGKVKRLAVDHCHDSGRVRALLCHSCNTVIALAKEDPGILRVAADYLESHRRAEKW
jgi:hypothetical protein